jgi:hypothetical protein
MSEKEIVELIITLFRLSLFLEERPTIKAFASSMYYDIRIPVASESLVIGLVYLIGKKDTHDYCGARKCDHDASHIVLSVSRHVLMAVIDGTVWDRLTIVG